MIDGVCVVWTINQWRNTLDDIKKGKKHAKVALL